MYPSGEPTSSEAESGIACLLSHVIGTHGNAVEGNVPSADVRSRFDKGLQDECRIMLVSNDVNTLIL